MAAQPNAAAAIYGNQPSASDDNETESDLSMLEVQGSPGMAGVRLGQGATVVLSVYYFRLFLVPNMRGSSYRGTWVYNG